MTQLLGLRIRLMAACRCGGTVAAIGARHELMCAGCGRRRGALSESTGSWLTTVVNKFGCPMTPIVVRHRGSTDVEKSAGNAGTNRNQARTG